MRTLAQNVALTTANSPLVFYHSNNGGFMTDPLALSFRIFRAATETEELAPVQVFPASGGGRAAVDLLANAVLPGGYGRFFATGWTPLAVGRHFVQWYWTTDVTTPEKSCAVPFDVQAFSIPVGTPFYGSLSDVRSAGIDASTASDAVVVRALKQASAFIERITGRWFEPRYIDQYYDGRGASVMLFNAPIIALDNLVVTTRPVHPADQPIDDDFIRVYNRHLSGLISPDDRSNPRLELFSESEDWIGVRPFSFSRMVFPKAQQNVRVQGVFGYTDPDGSPFGVTPSDIDLVASLLVPRYVPGLRADILLSTRLQSEGTRDQNYTLMKGSDLGLPTNLTGDAGIDSILAMYLRPPMFGSA